MLAWWVVMQRDLETWRCLSTDTGWATATALEMMNVINLSHTTEVKHSQG